MTVLTEPVVHYIRVTGGECRNAVVTEAGPSGDKLSLAVFEAPSGITFERGACHAPPPDPGGGTWHHLAECVPGDPPRALRDRITDELRSRSAPVGLSTRQLSRFLSRAGGPVTQEEVRKELCRMSDEGLTQWRYDAATSKTRWVLTMPAAEPARPLLWHEGDHAWDTHDGYPRHQHSLNGCLTIAPGDTRVHFAHGPEFT